MNKIPTLWAASQIEEEIQPLGDLTFFPFKNPNIKEY